MCSSGFGDFFPRQIVFLLCGLLIAIVNPSSSCGIQTTSGKTDDNDRFLIHTGYAKIIPSDSEGTAEPTSHNQEAYFRDFPQPIPVPLSATIPGNGLTSNLTDQSVIGTTNTPHNTFIETSHVQTASYSYSFSDSAEMARPASSVPAPSNHLEKRPNLVSRPLQPLEPIEEPGIDALPQMKQVAMNPEFSATTQLSPTAASGSRLSDIYRQENRPQTNSPSANSFQTNPSQITADSREFDIKNQLNRLTSNNFDWNAAIAAARQLESEEKYQEALKMYQSLSQRSAVPAIVYHRLAVLMDKTGQNDALPIYHKALAADPNSADLYADLGYRNQLLGDPSNAFYYYKQALAIDPGHSRAHINMGILSLQDGKGEDVAIDHFRKAGLSWIHAKQNARLITAYQQSTKTNSLTH